MPTEQKKWYQRLDIKDLFAVIGLGLFGWGIHRMGGHTALIFFIAIVALAFSGLLHVLVQYFEFHFVNSVRAITAKVKDAEKKVE
jgi:hypothetical protein